MLEAVLFGVILWFAGVSRPLAAFSIFLFLIFAAVSESWHFAGQIL
jgi:hypothetical protein